jgi:uncharacterized membrane protein
MRPVAATIAGLVLLAFVTLGAQFPAPRVFSKHVLAWAVRASLRSGAVRELIVVSDVEVVVERQASSGSRRTVFPRHWARVTLRGPQPAQHPSRLTIESHGRACEVGRFLTEDERRSLAARLERLVGKTSESPALAP